MNRRDRCAECGFDWERSGTEASASIERSRSRGRSLISDTGGRQLDDVVHRTRAVPDRWSALEYLAHLRDVSEFYDDRLHRVLTEERPEMGAIGFGELAEREGYNQQNPAVVLDALDAAAERVVTRLDDVAADQWIRVGIGSGGGERTLDELARRIAHEFQHHVGDIERVLGALSLAET